MHSNYHMVITANEFNCRTAYNVLCDENSTNSSVHTLIACDSYNGTIQILDESHVVRAIIHAHNVFDVVLYWCNGRNFIVSAGQYGLIKYWHENGDFIRFVIVTSK